MPKKPARSKSQVSVDKIKVTTAEAAELLEVTPRWIRELAKRGLIKKLATDQYLLPEVLRGYARSIEQDGRQNPQSKSAQRVFNAKGKELEDQIARELETLIEADFLIEILTDIEQIVERELGPVPNEIDDPPARSALAQYLDHELGKLRAAFGAAKRSLAAGKGLPDAAE